MGLAGGARLVARQQERKKMRRRFRRTRRGRVQLTWQACRLCGW